MSFCCLQFWFLSPPPSITSLTMLNFPIKMLQWHGLGCHCPTALDANIMTAANVSYAVFSFFLPSNTFLTMFNFAIKYLLPEGSCCYSPVYGQETTIVLPLLWMKQGRWWDVCTMMTNNKKATPHSDKEKFDTLPWWSGLSATSLSLTQYTHVSTMPTS